MSKKTNEPSKTTPAEKTDEMNAKSKAKAKKTDSNNEVATPTKERFAELEEKNVELADQHQRMLAEYANFKRRTEFEKSQINSFCKAEILKGLIPAMDSLEAAIVATKDSDEKVVEGLKMTMKQVSDILTSQGLEVIDPLNQSFNPEEHNAISRENSDDVDGDEIVTEVYQKGYKYDDRVLRPAMVKVAN